MPIHIMKITFMLRMVLFVILVFMISSFFNLFLSRSIIESVSKINSTLACFENKIFTQTQRNDLHKYNVPNLVHYIWYYPKPVPLKFHHMLSILGCQKFIQPDVIYFHTNMPPYGKYWDHIKEITSLKVIHREPSKTLFGETLEPPFFNTSQSNVDRVKILTEYGGIYLDFDVIPVQSFDALRKKPCTIGQESKKKMCGCVIICSKESLFLTLWANAFLDNYRRTSWAYNTGTVPFYLSRRFPHLISVEETRLNRPNWMELQFIWGNKRYDWSKNYAIHLWYRKWIKSKYYKGVEPNETNIGLWKGSFGEMARLILFGDENITKLVYNLSLTVR